MRSQSYPERVASRRIRRRLLLLLDDLLLLTCVILEGVLLLFVDFFGEELLAAADIAKNLPGMRDQVLWWLLEHHQVRHMSIARDLELQGLLRGRACALLLGEHQCMATAYTGC